jgi:hypothetical protein
MRGPTAASHLLQAPLSRTVFPERVRLSSARKQQCSAGAGKLDQGLLGPRATCRGSITTQDARVSSKVPHFILSCPSAHVCRTVLHNAEWRLEGENFLLNLLKFMSEDRLIDYSGLRHTGLELRPRSTWRNTHAIRKGGTTRNPVRNPPRSSCEKTRGGSGQTGICTQAHTRMAELKAIPRPEGRGALSALRYVVYALWRKSSSRVYSFSCFERLP